MHKTLPIAWTGVLLVLLGVSACRVPESPIVRAERERFQTITVGMTESAVTERLGQPLRRYRKESAPSPYYHSGYAYKERPISGGVLIYVGIETILYVYLDERGNVEEVFVGGS